MGHKQPFVFCLPVELEFHRHSCLRHVPTSCAHVISEPNKLQLAWYILGPFFAPFIDVLSDLLWFLGDNFEGYTTEVIFQSFKRHLMTITCHVSIQSYRACQMLGHMPPKIQGT